MPNELNCSGCNLAFSVGWYHYHGTRDGYWARTILTCSRCGTIHAVEHADTSGPCPVADRLLAQPKPVFADLGELNPSQVPLTDWLTIQALERPSSATASPSPVASARTRQRFDLSGASCAYCHCPGTMLVTEWVSGTKCPHCAQDLIKAAGGWMT